MPTLNVYNGTSDEQTITVKEQVKGGPDTAVDFSNATQIDLVLHGDTTETVSETSSSGGAIDWSAGSGKLTFKLGDESIPAGAYDAELIVYDSSHPNGQVIAHDSDGKLQVLVWD